MKKFIVILFLILIVKPLSATEQAADLFIYKNQIFYLRDFPPFILERYLPPEAYIKISKEAGNRSNACVRGYIATWTLEGDSLFLTKLENWSGELLSLEKYFPESVTSKGVFADWFNYRINAEGKDAISLGKDEGPLRFIGKFRKGLLTEAHVTPRNEDTKFSMQQPEGKPKQEPIIKDKSLADPSTLVHGETLYLYVTEDLPGSPARSLRANNWLVYSTTNLKDWKEHSVPLSLNTFRWAPGDSQAWASDVVEKNGKFYWYVTLGNFVGRPNHIAIAVSDSPTGPFKDALGKPLISDTPDWNSKRWGEIDPAVFVDDEGQAYIFWGGGECYYAKLKDSMIEFEGNRTKIDLPGYFAGPSVHKNKGKYYLSFGHQNPYSIGYAVSDNINGPWEYTAVLHYDDENRFAYQGAIQQFKDNWYFFYYKVNMKMDGTVQRSIYMDDLLYHDHGLMKRVK